MAWQIYDVLSDDDRRYGDPWKAQHGPMPKRRWVTDAKRKAHKLSYKFKYSQRGTDSADDYNERRAIEYARWLAKRDGIELPTGFVAGKVRVEWSGFYSATKTRNVRHWNGNLVQQAYCKRIRAVSWGREEERFNSRKDGRRGAWTHNEFVASVTIEIPNWDFEPVEPVEELVSDAPELSPVMPTLQESPVAPSYKVPSRFLASTSLVRAAA